MQCPVCGADGTRVIDSRPADDNSAIRRRRVCETCDHRFTTYERCGETLSVRKRSGELEPFNATKLSAGLGAALADRPASANQVSTIVGHIRTRLRGVDGIVDSDTIGSLVLDELRTVDEVAYLRFASVYKEFTGASDFEREMESLESAAD